VYCSMCLGVPFIAPRQLGAVGAPIGRQYLPSVRGRTGHEQYANSFLIWRRRPLQPPAFVAHRTVRCGLVTIGAGHVSPTDCALIALPTISAGAACSPDSPVHTRQSGEQAASPTILRATSSPTRYSLGTAHCPVHP
jgi:hypothetical protein